MPDIPARLPPILFPGEPIDEQRIRIFEAYRRELEVPDKELPLTVPHVNEAVRWWNAGAPDVDDGPTLAGEALAKLDDWIAAGGAWFHEGVFTVDEYRAYLQRQDRESRVAASVPRPDRPRRGRSEHAPTGG